MTTRQTRVMMLANFVFLVLVQLSAWAVFFFNINLEDSVVLGLLLVVAIDLLALTNRFVNHRFEIYRYLILAGISIVVDYAVGSRLRILFLVEFGILSYFLGCLLLKLLIRASGHRYVLAGEWDFFFDPLNWLLTVILMLFTGGLTFAAGVFLGRV